MTLIALFLPKEILYGIIGVSGATIFYDTIFKAFQKFFEFSLNKGGDEE